MLMAGHQHRGKPAPPAWATDDAAQTERRKSHSCHDRFQPMTASVVTERFEFFVRGGLGKPWNFTIHRNMIETFILWTFS